MVRSRNTRVHGDGGPSGRCNQTLLIVLDNCEHLLAASVQLIETLLHTCAQVRVLVTSREALAITGETTWPVIPLRVPDISESPPIEGLLTYEAVQLFVERARSVFPSFTLTPENASAVVQVCRRLDGMPLAIELAAAMRALSVEQIVARLDDAYRLPRGSRSALPRQQTSAAWTGAMACCQHMNRPSSVGSRCLVAVFRSKRQRPSAQASQAKQTTCWMSSPP